MEMEEQRQMQEALKLAKQYEMEQNMQK